MNQRHPEPELDELYRDLILDHYKRPRNRTIPEDAQVRAEGYNPVCGDEVEMGLKFDGDVLTDIGMVGHGCSISQASGSMMSELVKGKRTGDIRRLSEEFKTMLTDADAEVPEELGDLEALQGVGKFAVRVKCATLAWHTLADGIAQHDNGDGVVTREEA
jgi:nitrogen fixation protein NifU and related proteins